MIIRDAGPTLKVMGFLFVLVQDGKDICAFKTVKDLQEARRELNNIFRPHCRAYIRREFYNDGKHDGGETEFVYDDNPVVEPLLACQTLEDVRKVLLEPPKVGYYWIVTEVKLKDRTINS